MFYGDLIYRKIDEKSSFLEQVKRMLAIIKEQDSINYELIFDAFCFMER